MNKSLFITSVALLLLCLSPAQAQESAQEQSVVVVKYAGPEYVSSMRFEVTGAITEIKNCRASNTGTSAFLNECQSLGSYSTEDVSDILQAGWIESIMADAEQVGSFASGAAVTGAVVYIALNKVSKGLISKEIAKFGTVGSGMTLSTFIKTFLAQIGLYSANGTAALAGGTLAMYGYGMTTPGIEASAIDRRNEVAKKLQAGETVIEAFEEEAVSDLYSFVVGQINSLKSN